MSGNPFLQRVAARLKNAHGLKSEKRVTKSMGARRHPNSGAMVGAKSDASLVDANFRLEMKSTIHHALPVELAWLAKISKEAVSHHQRPAVVLSFVDEQGKPRLRYHSEWVCLPMDVFRELTSR